MKAVNVDEVLKILHRYGKYIFVTDEKKYSDMVDEIANLKALEQELCGDAVSRKAVLGMAKSYNTDGFDMYTPLVVDVEDIEELPPVTPQPRWIPVSEKLPNDRDWYLGIFREPDTGWINPLPFICDYVGRETKATTKEYWILRGFTDRDERIDYYFNLECVKWMPLPSSYEGYINLSVFRGKS